jgi:hypothetical protein
MKNVLVITYFWPPSGKASMQWPLGIARHLPVDGWQPIILTIKQDTFSPDDESLSENISSAVKVFRTNTYEPFSLYKKFTGKKEDDQLIASETISKANKSYTHRISIWLRMNLFIPDARIGWYFPAVKEGKGIIKHESVDAIISIGPPHSAHLIGKKLSKKFNIPHIPVFIDPWVDIIYYKGFKRSYITKLIDNHLEKSVLNNAKAVAFVTETMKNDYSKKYAFLTEKSNVLYWGYNEKDFESIVVKKDKRGEKLLVHAGNIFSFQNPQQLWKQLQEEIRSGNKYKIRFIGTVDPEIKKSITENNLDDYTEYAGFLPYYKMLQNICEADMLLVCVSEPRHVPGKLFEYLRTGNPVIAIGDNNYEVKKILKESNAGMIFGYNEPVKEFFTSYENLKPNPPYVVKFDRKKIASQMSKLLNSI